jgi:hypothetical protein
VGKTQFSSTGSAAVFAVARRLKEDRKNLTILTGAEEIELYGRDEIFLENFCKIVYKGIYPI